MACNCSAKKPTKKTYTWVSSDGKKSQSYGSMTEAVARQSRDGGSIK